MNYRVNFVPAGEKITELIFAPLLPSLLNVSPILPFLPSHNRVERFDLVDDNNAIVCPYKCTSTLHVSVCLSLDDERENV